MIANEGWLLKEESNDTKDQSYNKIYHSVHNIDSEIDIKSNFNTILNSIFIDKNSNAIQEFKDAIYCEFTYNGKDYACEFDGKDFSYNEESPEITGNLLPIIYWALADFSKANEFKDNFKKAKEEFQKEGNISEQILKSICSSFENEVVSNMLNNKIEIFEFDISIAMVRNAKLNGYLSNIELIDDLDLKKLSIAYENIVEKNNEER